MKPLQFPIEALDGIVIQVAQPEDAEPILALQRLAYQSEAILNQDWLIPPLTQTLEELRNQIASQTVLKAVHEETVIGSVRAYLENSTCQIGRLIVHPDLQGKGIGTRLIHAIEAAFPEAMRFELFTSVRSTANIRLYHRLGYTLFDKNQCNSRTKLAFMEKLRA